MGTWVEMEDIGDGKGERNKEGGGGACLGSGGRRGVERYGLEGGDLSLRVGRDGEAMGDAVV